MPSLGISSSYYYWENLLEKDKRVTKTIMKDVNSVRVTSEHTQT
jgi:hypothetical protein